MFGCAANQTVVQVKKGAAPTIPAPILLHCSAGVGRTGTFIAIAHGMYHLETFGTASPLKIVRTIRQDRMALVQHPKQFEFVHAALVRWAQMCNADYTIVRLFRGGIGYLAKLTSFLPSFPLFIFSFAAMSYSIYIPGGGTVLFGVHALLLCCMSRNGRPLGLTSCHV